MAACLIHQVSCSGQGQRVYTSVMRRVAPMCLFTSGSVQDDAQEYTILKLKYKQIIRNCSAKDIIFMESEIQQSYRDHYCHFNIAGICKQVTQKQGGLDSHFDISFERVTSPVSVQYHVMSSDVCEHTWKVSF